LVDEKAFCDDIKGEKNWSKVINQKKRWPPDTEHIHIKN
jgi:hypothetical protein